MSFYDQAMETAPREQLQTLQFQKLCKLVREISGRNRFYTKKWNDAGIIATDVQSFIAERVRAHIEQAIYYALSLRPAVKVAEPGTLSRFEMKARRFRRLDGASENRSG